MIDNSVNAILKRCAELCELADKYDDRRVLTEIKKEVQTNCTKLKMLYAEEERYQELAVNMQKTECNKSVIHLEKELSLVEESLVPMVKLRARVRDITKAVNDDVLDCYFQGVNYKAEWGTLLPTSNRLKDEVQCINFSVTNEDLEILKMIEEKLYGSDVGHLHTSTT